MYWHVRSGTITAVIFTVVEKKQTSEVKNKYFRFESKHCWFTHTHTHTTWWLTIHTLELSVTWLPCKSLLLCHSECSCSRLLNLRARTLLLWVATSSKSPQHIWTTPQLVSCERRGVWENIYPMISNNKPLNWTELSGAAFLLREQSDVWEIHLHDMFAAHKLQ